MAPPLYYLVKSRASSGDPSIVNFTSVKSLSPAVRAKVKRLGVEFFAPLPKDLGTLPNVEYLAIEGVHLASMRRGMIAPSVRTLNIVSDESTKYALPDGIVLPQLGRVMGFCKLVFRAEQLPNVTQLEVKVASAKMPAEIGELPLRSLGIGPIAGKATLAAFAKLELRELSLMRGTAKDLAGIEAFPKLESLAIKGMQALSDLALLAKLPGLAKLDISWCTGLSKVDAIGKLPKLRELDFWASDMPLATWRKLEKVLAKKRVKIVNPPECAHDDEDDE